MPLPRPDFTKKIKPLSFMESLKFHFSIDIHDAATARDWEKVKAWIMYHKNFNVDLNEFPIISGSYTVLHKAILALQYDIVALLLEHNVSPDIRAKFDPPETPLQIAYGAGALTAIKLLILNGVNYKNFVFMYPMADSAAALKIVTTAVEFVQNQIVQAEAFAKALNFKQAFIAYVMAGNKIFALTKGEADNYVIQHITKYAALYYHLAEKYYLFLSSEECAVFRDAINKMQARLKIIDDKLQLSLTETEMTSTTESTTPDSNNKLSFCIKRYSPESQGHQYLLGDDKHSDSSYGDNQYLFHAVKTLPTQSKNAINTPTALQIKKTQ